MLSIIPKPLSTTHEKSPVFDKKLTPLVDKPLFCLLKMLLIRNLMNAQKKMSEEWFIRSDINWMEKTKRKISKERHKIICSYWHLIAFDPSGAKIHKLVTKSWKKCLLAEMQTILTVFASFQNSSKWSDIPGQIRSFTSIAHKKVRLLLRENLKLPPSIAAIDCEKTIYAYALLKANLYALYLTNVYLREGIDLCMATLTKKGYDFTASQLALYKPIVTKAESMAIRKLMS